MCAFFFSTILMVNDANATSVKKITKNLLHSGICFYISNSKYIYSKIFNSAANKREFSDEVSINNSHDEIIEPNDHREILDDICSQLKAQEVTFLKYWSDGFCDKEIAAMFTMEAK